MPVRPEWKTGTEENPSGLFRETFLDMDYAIHDAPSSEPPPEPENAAPVCALQRELRQCVLDRQRVELKLEAVLVKTNKCQRRLTATAHYLIQRISVCETGCEE